VPDPTFLDRLSPDGRAALEAVAVTRRHRRGQTLFHEGDLSDSVVVLLEGTLKLTKLAVHGREVILDLRGRGMCLVSSLQ
jgi:CRP/FNR family transcriptional regulator, cyclic AMP receptor protein